MRKLLVYLFILFISNELQAQHATAEDRALIEAFGKDFLWGTSCSAYQIEGAWNEGGKSESVCAA